MAAEPSVTAPAMGSPADTRALPTRWESTASAALGLGIALIPLVWVLSLPQRLGLFVFPEQIAALILGLGLALVFLRYRPNGRLAGGAGWIAAVLAGSKAETRKRAVEALQSVLGGSHGDVARRALAGYAVELADAQAARAAMEGATSSAFEAGDRVALAALTGGSREEAEPWLNALLGDSELSPITAAASAALGSPTDENRKLYPVGSLRSKAAVSLGRMLASVMDRKDRSLSSNREFDDAVLAYADVAPDNGIARALKLELDVDRDG